MKLTRDTNNYGRTDPQEVSEDYLEVLLLVLGEFGHGSVGLFSFVEQHGWPGYDLARKGLQALARFVREGHFVNDQPHELQYPWRPSMPLFSKEFGQRLKQGERTQWAADLSEADWDFLLDMLKIVHVRSKPLLQFLEERAEEARVRGLSRARIALEFILMHPLVDVDETRRRLAEEP